MKKKTCNSKKLSTFANSKTTILVLKWNSRKIEKTLK